MPGFKLFVVICGCLLLICSAQAATHKGISLDHTEYTAKAHCVTSDQTFEKVSVKFDKDSVNIYFDDGGHLTLKLESEEIADPHKIVAHVTDKGYEKVTWVLDLSNFKETPQQDAEP